MTVTAGAGGAAWMASALRRARAAHQREPPTACHPLADSPHRRRAPLSALPRRPLGTAGRLVQPRGRTSCNSAI